MSTSSIVGYRNLRVQKLDASASDLDFTNTLLDTDIRPPRR